MKIGAVGFFKKPFDFYYISDLFLIQDLLRTRNEEISLYDWNDINEPAAPSTSFNFKGQKYEKTNLTKNDVVLFLEVPAEISTHADKEKSLLILDFLSKQKIPTINPAEVFLQNPDKSYILNNSNNLFPKTRLINNSSGLEKTLSEFGEEIVLKPFDGGGGEGVIRIKNSLTTVQEYIGGLIEKIPYIIQNYHSEIVDGERSLFFFDKQFKYAILKKPKKGEFKTNDFHLCEEINIYQPTELELFNAKRAINLLNTPALIERVDMMSSGILMELSFECPGFYIDGPHIHEALKDDLGKWFYELIDSVKR